MFLVCFFNFLALKRFRDSGIIGIALHPGVIVSTELMRQSGMLRIAWHALKDAWKTGHVKDLSGDKDKSVQQGVSTTIRCALDPHILPGGYYCDTKLETKRIHPRSDDEEHAKRLWDLSTQFIAKL